MINKAPWFALLTGVVAGATLIHPAWALVKVKAKAATKAPSQVIFDDKMENNWIDWSWAKQKDFSNTKPVHSGNRSISVTFLPGFEELSFHHDPFNTTGYKAFSFWINGGPTGGQKVRVFAVVGTKEVKPFLLPPLPRNAWKHVTVPLSALGVLKHDNVTAFWIGDPNGKGLPVLYVDDVKLIGG